MPYVRRKTKKAPTKKRSSKYYKRSRVSFEKRVKAIAFKTQETKNVTHVLTRFTNATTGASVDNQTIYGQGLALAPPAGTSPPIIYRGWVLPNIYDKMPIIQGPSESKRIGNEIYPVSCVMRGFIISNHFDVTTNNNQHPYEVKLIIYKAKKDITGNPNFIKQNPAGGNLNTPLDGSIPADMAPYNKDMYTIYKVRTWRFRGPANLQSQGNNGIFGSLSDKQFHRFRIRLPVPKKLQFGDNLTVASNHWFSLGFYTIFGDGQIKSAQAANVYAVCDLKFKDA